MNEQMNVEAEACRENGDAKFHAGNYQGAIDDVTKAIKLRPDFAEAYHNRGEAKWGLKNYPAAVADYSKAIKLKPEFELMFWTNGNALIGLKDYAGAVVYLTKAIYLNQNDAQPYFARGNAKAYLKDFAGAIADYNRAIDLDPKVAETFCFRGNARTVVQNFKGAIADYTRAIELKPDYADALRGRESVKNFMKDYKEAPPKRMAAPEKGSALYSPTFIKNTGTLILALSPRDARVQINKADYTGMQSIELPPGTYSIKVQCHGYDERIETFEVPRGGRIKKIISLEKNSGILTLAVTPPDALVLINRKDHSGESTVELAPGIYKIEVKKDGYYEKSELVELLRGGKASVHCALELKFGSLQFTILPATARVQLSRAGVPAYAWEGATVLEQVPAGWYDMVCLAPGHVTVKAGLTIDENKTIVEEIIMQKGAAPGNPLAGEFVTVPGGTFRMGGDGQFDEKPLHTISVSGFEIGKYPVTQKQWKEVMAAAPSNFKGDYLPVENVSWDDAQKFIQKLNQKEGATVYRLPREAEWEYAARGGAAGRGHEYSGANALDEVAWTKDNSGKSTHDVGTKQPNELGIHDMSGNVWEWCQDWYDKEYYEKSPQLNPSGAASGSDRVLRGGSWDDGANYCRVSVRSLNYPAYRSSGIGFRLVRMK